MGENLEQWRHMWVEEVKPGEEVLHLGIRVVSLQTYVRLHIFERGGRERERETDQSGREKESERPQRLPCPEEIAKKDADAGNKACC